MNYIITPAELDAAIARRARASCSAVAGLSIDDLLEAAAEVGEGGTRPAINGLLHGLTVRHSHDDATLAMLAAIEHLHLPNLLDAAADDAVGALLPS